MASKMHQLFPILCLAMVMLGLFASPTEAKFKGINPFCRTSDFRRVCNVMVAGATNLHDATKNALQSAHRAGTVLQKTLPEIEQGLEGVDASTKDDTVSTCKDTFDAVVDNVKQALQYFEANDIASVNTYLSAATSVTDCQDAFKEVGAEFPPNVAKLTKNVDMQISNCLAVTQQK